MKGFIQFIREQGVVGLAIGFILGGAVGKLVSSLVEDIVNPIIGKIFGDPSGLGGMMLFDTVALGAFVSALIDFLIIAFVVYYGFKALGLDKLDAKKEE